MKLSQTTRTILDNFSTINPSIIIRPGNVIRLGTPNLSLFCRATVEENFETQVGIHNLKKFLGVLSLFDDEPDLVFEESRIRINNGKQEISYVLSDQTLIKASPVNDPNVPEPLLSFNLTSEDLNTTMKAASVLGLPTVAFVGDGTNIRIAAKDGENTSKDAYSSIIGQSDKTFSTPLLRTSFKMMSLDYTVHVHSDYVKFESPTVTYWLPRQA
jgi:hypothetical protein